jgi:hypothetical protein
VGPGMALEEQDPGLVSAAVAWVEAARGVGPAGQARVGVCGSPSAVVALDLARDLEAEVRRVRVEEPEQGVAKAVEAAARVRVEVQGVARARVGVQGVEAAVAQTPAAVVPVADLVGPVQAMEGLEALGVRERAFLENG